MNESSVMYSMDSDAYRAADGLSHSDSRHLRKSPFHYHQLQLPRDPELVKKATAQMEMGTMVHCAVLEPHAFADRYVIGPDISHNSNEWKRFAIACDVEGLKPITEVQKNQAFAIAESVRKLPDFAALLDGGTSEVSLWWNCATTGVLCKARPDLVKHFPGAIVLGDLKTTEDASPEAFARSVADYSYHTQAQWYSEGTAAALGMPVVSFLFAVVEREYPYACASYTLDDNAMKVALDINIAAREAYKACTITGLWPGYPRETRDIALPPWYMTRYLAGQVA